MHASTIGVSEPPGKSFQRRNHHLDLQSSGTPTYDCCPPRIGSAARRLEVEMRLLGSPSLDQYPHLVTGLGNDTCEVRFNSRPHVHQFPRKKLLWQFLHRLDLFMTLSLCHQAIPRAYTKPFLPSRGQHWHQTSFYRECSTISCWGLSDDSEPALCDQERIRRAVYESRRHRSPNKTRPTILCSI